MRRPLLALGLVLAVASFAHGLTLTAPRVEATLFGASGKDPFRIRAQLGEVDLAAVVQGPVIVRFGDLQARVPAGGFRRGGKNAFTWRSYTFGVKKVTVNVKKATLDVVGGGVELGELPAPVTLARWAPSTAPSARGSRGRRPCLLETDAAAASLALGREAALEDTVGDGGIDSPSRVRETDLHRPADLLRLEREGAAVGHRVARVRGDVADRPLQTLAHRRRRAEPPNRGGR